MAYKIHGITLALSNRVFVKRIANDPIIEHNQPCPYQSIPANCSTVSSMARLTRVQNPRSGGVGEKNRSVRAPYPRRSSKALPADFSLAFTKMRKVIREPNRSGTKRTVDMTYNSQAIYLLTTLAVPLVFLGMFVGRFMGLQLGLGIMLLAAVLESVSLYASLASYWRSLSRNPR